MVLGDQIVGQQSSALGGYQAARGNDGVFVLLQAFGDGTLNSLANLVKALLFLRRSRAARSLPGLNVSLQV